MISSTDRIMKKMLYFFLVLGIFIIYLFQVSFLGNLESYFTNVHYVQLLENVSSQTNQFGFNIIGLSVNSALTIATYEPLLAFVYTLFGFFTSDFSTVNHVLSALFIGVYSILVFKSKVNILFKLIFLCSIAFGFYEFILLSVTHRLGLAFIFLTIAFASYDHKPNIWRGRMTGYFVFLACVTHFSILFVLPLIWIFKIYYRISLKTELAAFFQASLLFLVLLMTSYFFYEGTEVPFKPFQNKLIVFYQVLAQFYMIGLLMAGVVAMIYFTLRKRIAANLALFFIGLSIYLFIGFYLLGTSRLLQLYCLALPLIFMWSSLHKSQPQISWTGLVIISFPMFSLVMGFLRNPLFTQAAFY